MDRLYMLKYGLAVVLIFVGLKIARLHGPHGGKCPMTISRGFIASVIALSVVASLLVPRRHPSAKTGAVPGAGSV